MGGKAPPIIQFLLFVYAVTVDYRVYIVPWFTPHMSKVPGILIVCRSNTLFRLSLHINTLHLEVYVFIKCLGSRRLCNQIWHVVQPAKNKCITLLIKILQTCLFIWEDLFTRYCKSLYEKTCFLFPSFCPTHHRVNLMTGRSCTFKKRPADFFWGGIKTVEQY